jgi:peptidoglycan hydrolase-like protein with peptidoglycan-binding domain
MKTLSTCMVLMSVAGCGAPDDRESGLNPPAQPSVTGGQLMLGSSGAAVRAVNEYLKRFGYFPSADLAAQYPAWRPIVDQAPADPLRYDEHTAAAVRALQSIGGLAPTGVVDEATRVLLARPRCGVPDGIERLDASDKFANHYTSWAGRTSLTYRLQNTDDVSLPDARAAVSAALSRWSQQTNMTFSEVGGAADIEIRFSAIDGFDGALGSTTLPLGGDVTLDTAETWSASPTLPAPPNTTDLQYVLIHELGHALGIRHSSVTNAVMLPFYDVPVRGVAVDDKVAVSALYDTFTTMPGSAKDIGIGASGHVWIIGTDALGNGDFGIYNWSLGSWRRADGGAIRIAVSPTGVPWVVNAGGNIWRRTTNSATTGTWELMPGLATDIGIGYDGSVWIVGSITAPAREGQIFKFNGSGWDQANNGSGVRISVGPSGDPWILTSTAAIFHRNSSSPFSGNWIQQLGNVYTFADVGVGPGNYAWSPGFATTGASGLLVRDEQPALDGAPSRAEWVLANARFSNQTRLINVAVDSTGSPWLVAENGAIFRSTR